MVSSTWRVLLSRLLLLLALLSPVFTFAADVEVQALFTNAAMLKIDGRSKLLKAGQSEGVVALISADSRQAVIEVDGQRQTLGVSGRISGSYHAPEVVEVRIQRDQRMQYQSQARFNGQGLRGGHGLRVG